MSDSAFEQALAIIDQTAPRPKEQVEEQVDVETLDWAVDDPDGLTEYDETQGRLLTTLPDGIVVGWDTCGCGRSVVTCGCDPIKMPPYVLKMRDEAKAFEAALEASLRDAENDVLEDSEPNESAPSRASQKPKKKIFKRGKK